MKLKTRTKRTICAIIGTAGVLLMAITAMASDSVNIQLGTIIKLEVLAHAMCWGGFYKGGYLQ